MFQQGFFITFEGGDGVSKTTQSKLLLQYLQESDCKTLLTREPGGTALGEEIRNMILKGSTANTTDLLLLMAARSQHLDKVIKPALQKGMIVICDRFIDSTAAYQSNENLDIKIIYELHAKLFGDMLPDLTILLELDPEEAFLRRDKREINTDDKMENQDLSFHLKVHQHYKKISQMFPERIKIIPTNDSVSNVQRKIEVLINQISYFQNKLL